MSGDELSGKVVMGNTFDYAAIHGKAILAAGHSFTSTSETAFIKQHANAHIVLNAYPLLDIIYGVQKQFDARTSTLVDDYIKVLRKLWRGNASLPMKRRLIAEKAELEEFFHSGWYEMLTDIDPDKLIYQCRIRAKEKEMAAIERANKKKIKELLREAE